MNAIPDNLLRAAAAARGRLEDFSQQAAVANTARGLYESQAAMAGAAREAIFGDALLAAMHARLEELKSVAK